MSKSLRVFAVVAAITGLSAAYLWAQQSPDNVIKACVSKEGTLKIITGGSCNVNEIALSWNQVGPQGPAGAVGPQGPAGPQGPQGEPSSVSEARVAAIEQQLSAMPKFGTTVVDKTGLSAYYELSLRYSTTNADDGATALPTALREQLGLMLQPVDAPAEVLVIDHIERPSEN